MYSTIKIECIGAQPDPVHLAFDKMLGGLIGVADCYKPRYWVAEITGICTKYGLARKFLSPRRDASKSNSAGSRGIYASYMLEHGKIYEISSPRSWKKTDRFFCEGSEPSKILNKEEVLEWLKTRSE